VWSPDQNLLAYVRSIAGVPQIRLMSPGGLYIRNAIDVGVVPGDQPAWDSHRAGSSFTIAYVNDGDLFEVHIPTDLPTTVGQLSVRPIRLTDHPGAGPDSNPVFSPDGTKILFQRGDNIMVMSSTPGSTPRALTTRVASDPDWEPLCLKTGGPKGSKLIGTPGDDLLCGGPGNDTIDGMGGDDIIFAGNGADTIDGGYGNDFILGGVGDSPDAIHGGPGDDYIEGGLGNNVLWGDDGNDRLEGGGGNDRLFGGPGNDELVGGPDSDMLDGGADNDLLNAVDHGSSDESDGSDGTDTCFTDSGDKREGCELPRNG
jgi:hypothetical protein